MFGLRSERATLANSIIEVCSESFIEDWIEHSYLSLQHATPNEMKLSNIVMVAYLSIFFSRLYKDICYIQDNFIYMDDSSVESIFEDMDNCTNQINCILTKMTTQQMTFRWFLNNHTHLFKDNKKLREVNDRCLNYLGTISTNYYTIFIKAESMSNWVPHLTRDRWRDLNTLYTFNVNEWIMNERLAMGVTNPNNNMPDNKYYPHMKRRYINRYYKAFAPIVSRFYADLLKRQEVCLMFCLGIQDSLRERHIEVQPEIIDIILSI